MSPRLTEVLVFRDGRRSMPGPVMRTELLDRVRSAARDSTPSATTEALLAAGEAECVLADAGLPCAAATSLTDAMADRFVGATARDDPFEIARAITLPPTVRFSVPEGFAYYALHPLDHARAAAALPVRGPVAVIGIRTIGLTLAAVVSAALRRRGLPSARITVRPHGHPYDRRVDFDPSELRFVHEWLARDATFVVVDEGPGLSGSSFLSVADALVGAGVASGSIWLMPSYEPDLQALVAPDAARRWSAFRTAPAKARSAVPAWPGTELEPGQWRARWLDDEAAWPGCWAQTERLKYASEDDRALLKFEGLGRVGSEVSARAMTLHGGGFAPLPRPRGGGFVEYDLCGKPLTRNDVDRAQLQRMADYCAFRSQRFVAEPGDVEGLRKMVRTNLADVLPAHRAASFELEVVRPVIADGRMMPWEWVEDSQGRVFKVDGTTHGDDHFYPGPVDIAWDLAGAIVEWELDAAATARLVERYQRQSGDRIGQRLPGYMLAYAAARRGFSQMAADATPGAPEHRRLVADAARYRAAAERGLRSSARGARGPL